MEEENLKEIVASKSFPPSVVCAELCAYFITIDRTIAVIGKNENHRLGFPNKKGIIFPIKEIPNISQVKMLTCGSGHMIFLNFQGEVFSIGNISKRLSIKKFEEHLPYKLDIPTVGSISSGTNFCLLLTVNNNLYFFGDNKKFGLTSNIWDKPILVPDLPEIDFIQSGGFFSIFRNVYGDFYSWGASDTGYTGIGLENPPNHPVMVNNWPKNSIDVKCGDHHCLILTEYGIVYSCGDNEDGQLGFEEGVTNLITPSIVNHIPLIKRIECGYNNSMCIDKDNNLWVFGYNEYAQLGLGDTENRYKPTLNESLHDIIDISSGGDHTFVKTINNEIYAYGDNDHDQIGILVDDKVQEIPVKVLEGNEDLWGTNIFRSKQKSARK